MKLSKSLLKAMAVGLTIGTASSCTLNEMVNEEDLHQHDETCDVECKILDTFFNVNNNSSHDNCPSCGMG